MNNNGYQLPVYIAKGVYTSGHIADIGPLQLGIIDNKTHSVATGVGNGKEFYLAGGSMHTKDQLSKWFGGMKQPKKSEVFKGHDIHAFEKSTPARPQSEQWVLGYDGSKTAASLQYEPGKIYYLKIRLYGQPVYQFWGGDIERLIHLYTGCPAAASDCVTGCDDPVYLGAKAQTRAWVKAINDNPDLKEFGIKAYPVFSDYASTSSSIFKYILKVVDNGDAGALQTVQRQYAKTLNISRVGYNRGVSTYTTDYVGAQPAAFAPKVFVYPPDCGACLSGDTLVDTLDIYTVRRQLASSTDLDDATARAAYAAQVVTDYSGVTGSAVYGGIINGEATVTFKHTHTDTELAPLNSDVISRSGVTEALCVPSTPSTVAWVQDAGGYVQNRTFTITIPNEDCANPTTLAQVQGFLASTPGVSSGNVTDITDTTGTGIDADHCVKVFQVIQTSNVMSDKYCMTTDNVTFADLPNFKGSVWQEAVTDEVYDATLKVGIRIVAPFVSQQFGIDSYDPKEYYDIDPTQMEVSLWKDDAVIPCEFNRLVQARRTVGPKFARLSGNFVMQHYISRNTAYKTYEEWANDPRGREVIDNTVLSQLKREAYYVAYYLRYKSKKDQTNFHQAGEEFDTIIYVDEADKATQDALENAIQAVTSRFRVSLTNRGK